MTAGLTTAERLKLALLAEGLTITERAGDRLREATGDGQLTPADYASTSGLILRLADDVWVNAPVADHNPNFVDHPSHVLDLQDDALVVHGPVGSSPAGFWIPPAYHDTDGPDGPWNWSVFTHADRARLAPVGGCSMTCKFCNIPYEDRYRLKPAATLLAALERALSDEVQPARHVLISGGTPKAADHGYLQDVYEQVVRASPVPVDIMMVPVDDLLDPQWLDDIGVNELSINLEVWNREEAARLMRQKHDQGRELYLDFLGEAVEVMGPGRVRSMVLVGLEPVDDTLAAVDAIVRRGAVPVLSPFRPDPATPLRSFPPPPAELLEDVYVRADDVARSLGGTLGPGCLPCTHNTLAFASSGADGHTPYLRPLPNLV